MPTDPVLEALRAAAEAAHAVAMAQDVCDTSADAEMPITAAAVAAFLREVSARCDGGSVSLDCGEPCGPHTMHDTLPLEWLAAAVERAAREAGE